jgi:hypothetical protein
MRRWGLTAQRDNFCVSLFYRHESFTSSAADGRPAPTTTRQMALKMLKPIGAAAIETLMDRVTAQIYRILPQSLASLDRVPIWGGGHRIARQATLAA